MPLLRAAGLLGVAVSVAGCPAPDNSLDTDRPHVEPPPDLPTLRITAPDRGAFLPGPVTVVGQAAAGTGALASLRVDGEEVAVQADGTFSVERSPPPGIFILGSRLEDDIGERAVDGRAVHVGPVRPPGDTIPRAVVIQLGPELLDDDDDAPDDVASVVERLIEDPAFTASLVGRTFDDGDLTVRGMTIGAAAVDITPQRDVLWMDATLTDLDLAFTKNVWGFDVDGTTHSDAADIAIDIVVDVGPIGIVARASAVDVSLSGFTWEGDGIPFDSWFTATVRDMQETALEEQITQMVPELLGDLLSAFAFDLPIGGASHLGVSMSLADATSAPEGLVIALDAAVTAPSGTTLPPGAGSLRTDRPGPALPLATWEPLALAIDDDLVNQVLFATWYSGVLADVELSRVELLAMTGEDFPPPLGPVDTLTVDLGLPPVLAPATDISGDGTFSADLAVGELWLDIRREDGEHVTVSLNMRAGTDLSVQDSGIVLDLDDRPAAVQVHAGMLTWPSALDPGDLAALFRLAAPRLVGGATDFLPSLPTPSIDLGSLSDADALDGVVWTIDSADVVVEDSGWVVITGEMR